MTAMGVTFPVLVHAAGTPPSSGSELQEVQPSLPQPPASNKTGLTIDHVQPSALPVTKPFMVRAIRITGNKKVDTATLHALVAEGEGHQETLSQLRQFAGRITDYYHVHGYPLARAVIPAQRIVDGVVTFQVLEAVFGKVGLSNHSRVNTDLLRDTLAPLQSGAVVEQSALDKSLLLLSDIPGVAGHAMLQPGAQVGTSDLNVTADATPMINGNVGLSDYGNAYTGRVLGSGNVNIVNPLHRGDVLSLSGQSSGSDMNYGRVGYETLLNGMGTRVGGAFSALHYILGSNLASLHGNGRAETSSAWARQPIIRSQDDNLYVQLQYDHLALIDSMDSTGVHDKRQLENWTGIVNGDWRDAIFTGSSNTWSLALTGGQASPAATSQDATQPQGGFLKLNFSYTRLQQLTGLDSLYMAVSGQLSNTHLDISQQLVVGGPYTVRAYDMGVLTGDEGVLGTIEWRHELGYLWSGALQTVAFADSEHVTIDHNLPTGPVVADNTATLSGAGVGMNWVTQSQWVVKVCVAAPVGPGLAQVPNASPVRAWLQIVKGF